MKQHFSICTAVASAISLATISLAVAQETSLPGGAASLREAHGDWTVACAIQTHDGKKTKSCVLAQEQFAKNTRQRAVAIELKPTAGGVKGTLILPFGLALDKGITFQLDEGQPGGAQRFRTCLPAGCVIAIDFDARLMNSFKAAKVLKVKGASDTGQDATFSISLNGFPGALDRTAALMMK